MAEYSFENASNLSTPIGGALNGAYIKYDLLPESIKILISNTNYVTLVREQTTSTSSGGGRTSGTMWYNKQILGFTVEDVVRDKKIQNKTAIPDTIEDPSKFNGIPSNVYTIRLTTSATEFIEKSFYNGKGMTIESKSAKNGSRQILESDVFESPDFATDRGNLAFDGVFIHQGNSEGSSAGCIIFSRTKKADKTITLDAAGVQNLNKFLSENVKLIGSGKTQQFVIVNLWEFPNPPLTTTTSGTIINGQTNQPITGVQVNVIPPTPSTPIDESFKTSEENTSEIFLP